MRRIALLEDPYFGSTEYHPQEQWLVKVWDFDRNAERVYAVRDINEFAEVPESERERVDRLRKLIEAV